MNSSPENNEVNLGNLSQELQTEIYDEQYLITREFTHVDSTDSELRRLGYFWPTQVSILPLVK